MIMGNTKDWFKVNFFNVACFENYLSIQLFDVSNSQTGTESRFVQQGGFLAFYDHLIKHIYEHQSHALYQYVPYCITSFHRLFSTAKSLNIAYPKMAFEVETARKQIQGIAVDLWGGMSISNQSRYKSHNKSIMELAPYLLYSISENLNPTNIQLLKPTEKRKLDHIVNLFHGFGLNLEKVKTELNTSEYVIEPRLDLLVDFLPFCKDRRTITDGSYTVNQLIQHHVESARIKSKEDISRKKEGSAISTPAKIRSERAITLQDLVPTQIAEVKAGKVLFCLI
jgi:hypothetical protein